jgi:hypothetical protein
MPFGVTVLTWLIFTLAMYSDLPSGLNFRPVGLNEPSAVFKVMKSARLRVLGSNITIFCPMI